MISLKVTTFILLVVFVFSQKNVILIIGDGFGPTAHTLARKVLNKKLSFDQDIIGTVQTHSYNQLITDSSSSATAYACGIKTINGFVGVDHTQKRVKNLIEAAHEKGMLTGIVTSTSVQHATPASFLVHHYTRQEYEVLAELEAKTNVSLLIGGGRKFFIPTNLGGTRRDGRNIIEEIKKRGISVLQSTEEFMRSNFKLPTFAFLDSEHMPYEIDRNPNQPSLLEVTRKALSALKGHPKGFFLMIEAGRIDHAFHGNDAGSAIREIGQMDQVYEFIRNFVKNEKNTILLATADHETSGLSLSIDPPIYQWYPDVFRKQRGSGDKVKWRIENGEDIRKVVREEMSIELTTNEFNNINKNRRMAATIIGQIMGSRAKVTFTNTQHSGCDVLLHAFGTFDFKEIKGNTDNTDIGKFIAKYLNLNMNF